MLILNLRKLQALISGSSRRKSVFPGELVPEEEKQFLDTLKTDGEWRGEFHNRKKNGEYYWEFASIYAIKNSLDGCSLHKGRRQYFKTKKCRS